MRRVSSEFLGGVSTTGHILFALQNSVSNRKLHLCFLRPFLFLKLKRHVKHFSVTFSDSDSASEEE